MECLNDLMASAVRDFPDRPFIVSAGETVTYAEFDRRAAKLAEVLRSFGVDRGDPVGIYLPSNLQAATAYWACQRLGAITAPMSVMYRGTEIRHAVELTGMKVLITNGTGFAHAQAAGVTEDLGHTLVFGAESEGGTRIEPLIAAASGDVEPVKCDRGDIACLFFTSGTTGKSKAVMQTQFNQYAGIRSQIVFFGMRYGQETILNVLPIFNNFGATSMMNLSVFCAGTMLLHERWDTEAVLNDMKAHRVTYFAGTPTMYVYMCEAFSPDRHDLSCLKRVMVSGAPAAEETIKRFNELSGCHLIEVYGATETIAVATVNSRHTAKRPGSVGQPFGDIEIDIVDDNGNILPAGEIGEIRIRSEAVFKGYWKNPEANATAFSEGGWLSGDVGYLDEDRFLFLVDRKKDVIISGGYNIYPAEVEEVLYTHPEVGMCSVIGVPERAKGEVPVAVIVLKDGATCGEQAFIDFCRERISAYKVPRRIHFIDEMPLGPTGKILKRVLRDWAGEGRLS